mgnify:CR=1 FL=1
MLLSVIANGIGLGIIMYVNIGSDSVSVFCDGLHKAFSLSYGQASRAYNIICLGIALIVNRKCLGIGSIVSALSVGYILDFTYNCLVAQNIYLNIWGCLVGFLAGQILYAFGLSLLISCNLGMHSLDGIIYWLSAQTGCAYRNVRVLLEASFTLIGFVIGGVVGAGTLISVLSTGYMIQFFVNRREKRNGVNVSTP